jgi:hypothetical protein
MFSLPLSPITYPLTSDPLYGVGNSGCWPFTTFIYSMVRAANLDGECTNAPRALKFLQFLHDQTSATAEAAASFAAFTTDNADSALAAALASSDTSESDASSSLQRTSLIAEQLGAFWALPIVRALVQAKLKQLHVMVKLYW